MEMSTPINKPKADESTEDDFVLCEISSDEEPATTEWIKMNEKTKTVEELSESVKRMQKVLDEKTKSMQMLQSQISDLSQKNEHLLDEVNENDKKGKIREHRAFQYRELVWFISINLLLLLLMYWLCASYGQYECKLQMMNNAEFEQYHQTMKDNESLKHTVHALSDQIAPKNEQIRELKKEIFTLDQDQNELADYAQFQRKNAIKFKQKMTKLQRRMMMLEMEKLRQCL